MSNRYFVLREIEIEVDHIKVGDIFRIEAGQSNVHPKAYFLAQGNAEVDKDGYVAIPHQVVGVIPVGVEYNLKIKNLSHGINKY